MHIECINWFQILLKIYKILSDVDTQNCNYLKTNKSTFQNCLEIKSYFHNASAFVLFKSYLFWRASSVFSLSVDKLIWYKIKCRRKLFVIIKDSYAPFIDLHHWLAYNI